MKLKVILPAGQIPLGAVVTKRTGHKEYILGDCVKVYGVAIARALVTDPRVQASAGTVFLISKSYANSIPTTTELVWVTDHDELIDYLNSLE